MPRLSHPPPSTPTSNLFREKQWGQRYAKLSLGLLRKQGFLRYQIMTYHLSKFFCLLMKKSCHFPDNIHCCMQGDGFRAMLDGQSKVLLLNGYTSRHICRNNLVDFVWA